MALKFKDSKGKVVAVLNDEDTEPTFITDDKKESKLKDNKKKKKLKKKE